MLYSTRNKENRQIFLTMKTSDSRSPGISLINTKQDLSLARFSQTKGEALRKGRGSRVLITRFHVKQYMYVNWRKRMSIGKTNLSLQKIKAYGKFRKKQLWFKFEKQKHFISSQRRKSEPIWKKKEKKKSWKKEGWGADKLFSFQIKKH